MQIGPVEVASWPACFWSSFSECGDISNYLSSQKSLPDFPEQNWVYIGCIVEPSELEPRLPKHLLKIMFFRQEGRKPPYPGSVLWEAFSDPVEMGAWSEFASSWISISDIEGIRSGVQKK